MLNGESSKKSWCAVVTNSAKKQLRRISAKDKKRVEATIQEVEENPFGGDVAKLGGEGSRWRRRIGSYRIMYNILHQDRIVFIYDVRRRTSSTY